jgi:RNA polymerase sigma-70 factor (ECF subfamily)
MKRAVKELDLIERLQNGDTFALESVMQQYETKVFNTAYNIVKNHNDAQEITQDVFFTIFRKIHTFKGNSSFYTWIYRITVNYSFMKLRGRRKEKHIPIDEIAKPESDEALLTTIIPDKRKFADETVIEREIMEKVLHSMDQLPDKYRVVFQLRDLKQFSNEEVSQMLNLSVAAVKSRIHRARLFLREKIQDFSYATN